MRRFIAPTLALALFVFLNAIYFGNFARAQNTATLDKALFASKYRAKRPRDVTAERINNRAAMIEPGALWQSGDIKYAITDKIIPPDAAQIEKDKAALSPTDQKPYFRLALAYALAHDWGNALYYLNEQIILFPQSYPAMSLRGTIYNRIGRYDLADEDLTAAYLWNEAWRWQDGISNQSHHDRQKAYIRAQRVIAKAGLGNIDPRPNAGAAITELQYLNDYIKSYGTTPALTLAAAEASAAIDAKKSGISPSDIALINADIANSSNQCTSAQNLEKAINMNYRKSDALGRLVERYELCADFAKATELRKANPILSTRPPFATTSWSIRCPEKPELLTKAYDEGYLRFWTGKRLGKYYLTCNNADVAFPYLKSASLASIPYETKKNDITTWFEDMEIDGLYAKAAAATGHWDDFAIAHRNVWMVQNGQNKGSADEAQALENMKNAYDVAKLRGVNSSDFNATYPLITNMYNDRKRELLAQTQAKQQQQAQAREASRPLTWREEQAKKEQECVDIANNVTDAWNRYSSSGYTSSSGMLDKLRGICNVAQQAQSQAKYKECQREAQDRISSRIRAINGEMESISAALYEATKRHDTAWCVGGS